MIAQNEDILLDVEEQASVQEDNQSRIHSLVQEIANNDNAQFEEMLEHAIPELSQLANATPQANQEENDCEITSHDQYVKYMKAMYRFERKNTVYNITSIFVFIPLLLITKLVNLGCAVVGKGLVFLFQFLLVTLKVLLIFTHTYYESCIDMYGIISLSMCISMNSSNILSSVFLGLCLLNHARLLLGLQRYLIANILGTLDNLEGTEIGRKKYFWMTQIVHNLLLLTTLVINRNHTNKVYIGLLSSALATQVLYYSIFPYYLKYKCTNMGWLLRYGCKERMDFLLDAKVKIEIDALLPLEASRHVCDSNYNGMCSKCPCAICYDNLDEITTLKCGHMFHLQCMRQTAIYEYHNYQKVDCPTCRANLI